MPPRPFRRAVGTASHAARAEVHMRRRRGPRSGERASPPLLAARPLASASVLSTRRADLRAGPGEIPPAGRAAGGNPRGSAGNAIVSPGFYNGRRGVKRPRHARPEPRDSRSLFAPSTRRGLASIRGRRKRPPPDGCSQRTGRLNLRSAWSMPHPGLRPDLIHRPGGGTSLSGGGVVPARNSRSLLL